MSKNLKKTNKKKRSFSFPSSIAIIIGVLFFVIFLSWLPHDSWEVHSNVIILNGSEDSQSQYWLDQTSEWLFLNKNFIGFDDYYQVVGIQQGFDWAGSSLSDITSEIQNKVIEVYQKDKLLFSFQSEEQFSYTNYFLGVNEWFSFGGDGSWFASSTGKYGLFDVPLLIVAGFFSGYDVIFYVFAIGAAVEILMRTKVLESSVSSLVKSLKGKEIILVPTLFLLFSIGGTLFGMQEETLGLIPIIIPILIISGFDSLTGFFVIVIGTTVGISSSVLDPFSIGVMSSSIGASISDGVVFRLLLFFIYTLISGTFVTIYAMRVKKNKNNSLQKESLEENYAWAKGSIGDIENSKSLDKKQKLSITLFLITFSWMIFALLPWGEWFPQLLESNGWIVFSSFFFCNVLLGNWYFVQFTILFLILTFIISKIFNYDKKQLFSVFKTAFFSLISVAIILTLSRSISIVLKYSGLTYSMVSALFGDSQQNNPYILALILLPLFLILSLFIPSTSGLAGITGPLIGEMLNGSKNENILIITVLMIYPLAQGVINMVSPTTGLIMVQAESSKVKYQKAFPFLIINSLTILVVGLLSIMVFIKVAIITAAK